MDPERRSTQPDVRNHDEVKVLQEALEDAGGEPVGIDKIEGPNPA